MKFFIRAPSPTPADARRTPPEELIEVVKEVYARYRLGNLGVLKLVLDWIETVRPRL